MPTYKYEAAYASGEKVNGVVEAVSQIKGISREQVEQITYDNARKLYGLVR